MITNINTDIVNTVSHLIQLAVAPVFLLAGVAGLLNVFTGRFTRIIDKVERLETYEEEQIKLNKDHVTSEISRSRRSTLTKRLKNINLAILFGTMTGVMVSLLIITMFLSSLLEFKGSTVISMLFIFAMISLLTSLLLFLREIFYTTSSIKEKKI
jgi:uncharacterized iron-regulated membrane protein